ncbi:MAG: hypothetical protein AAB544_01705 [Patescibacteria group bacterium]
MNLYHLIIYVPVTHTDTLRTAIADAGGGKLGNYDNCSFSTRGIGRFRPLKGASPYIGSEGTIEEVEEERIEVVVEEAHLKDVLEAARKAHPYEEPAIQYWKVLAG